MRNKAKEYADKVCGENDEYLKIYHAYEDGHSAGRDVKFGADFMIGLCAGVIIVCFIVLIFDEFFNIPLN